MTKRTVPENAEHSPVNKGAAETFRPVACQCANATGRVPSLREAEAAAGPDARSHPETPRASLLPQSACASQAAPRPRPPLPVLRPAAPQATLRPGTPCSTALWEGYSQNSMIWSLSSIWSISSHKATFKRLKEAILLLLCYKQPITDIHLALGLKVGHSF